MTRFSNCLIRFEILCGDVFFKFPGNVLDISWTCSRDVLGVIRTCSGHDLDMFNTRFGQVSDKFVDWFWTCSGDVQNAF